jgi:hypothetical protein
MWKESDWEYDTSAEDSTSVSIITGAAGKLFFVNPETELHLDFRYTVLSVGAAKGPVFNVAKSLVSTPSGGLTKVQLRNAIPFDVKRFPCKGVVISGGLTAGIFAPSFIDDAGAEVSFLAFGLNPLEPLLFAWLPVWGLFSSILPGAGVSMGFLSCQQANSYRTVSDVPSSNIG